MKEPIGICIIGGTGRSGTTILKNIFRKHPDVVGVPEWRIVTDPDGLIDFYEKYEVTWTPFNIDAGLNRLEETLMRFSKDNFIFKQLQKVYNYLGFSRKGYPKIAPKYTGFEAEDFCPNYKIYVKELMEDLIDYEFTGYWSGSTQWTRTMKYQSRRPKQEAKRVINEFYMKLVRDACQRSGKRFFIEDNPWSFILFDKYLELVPEAKLVHIRRDPRDVVCSYMTKTWAPGDHIKACGWYLDLMQKWEEVKKNLPEESYLEITLEKLIAEKGKTIEQVANFWKINWDDSLLEVKLNKGNVGRWKNELNEAQQKEVGELLKQFDALPA